MTQKPGHLWAVIQEWIDDHHYAPTQRQLAKRIGVSHGSITEWKYARSFPGPRALERLAAEMRVPYERVLDAALKDAGYRTPPLSDSLKRINETADPEVDESSTKRA